MITPRALAKILFQFFILASFFGFVNKFKKFVNVLAEFSPIYGPADEVNTIYEALGVLRKYCWLSTNQGPQIACNRVEQLPKLCFKIKGRLFPLEPSRYTHRSNDLCYLSILATSKPFWNFDGMLGAFSTVYNATNNKIGFEICQ